MESNCGQNTKFNDKIGRATSNCDQRSMQQVFSPRLRYIAPPTTRAVRPTPFIIKPDVLDHKTKTSLKFVFLNYQLGYCETRGDKRNSYWFDRGDDGPSSSTLAATSPSDHSATASASLDSAAASLDLDVTGGTRLR